MGAVERAANGWTQPEAAPAQPPHHAVAFVLDPGWGVRGSMTCAAPPDAWCRQTKSCDCWEDGTVDCPHPFESMQECNVLLWIDGEVAEAYNGQECPVRNGPVIPTWDGDGFEWDYAEPAQATS